MFGEMGIVPSTSDGGSRAASACFCLGWRLPCGRMEVRLTTTCSTSNLRALEVNNPAVRQPYCVVFGTFLPLAWAGTFGLCLCWNVFLFKLSSNSSNSPSITPLVSGQGVHNGHPLLLWPASLTETAPR